MLLEKGADPNMASTKGDPLIYHTLEFSYLDMLRILIKGNN